MEPALTRNTQEILKKNFLIGIANLGLEIWATYTTGRFQAISKLKYSRKTCVQLVN
jgi:hypothetical protein